MKQLTDHFRHIRRQLIDGSILDMRYMVHNVLKDFDDITFPENQLEFLINNLALEPWEKGYFMSNSSKNQAFLNLISLLLLSIVEMMYFC